MRGRGAANNPAMTPGTFEPRPHPPAVQTGIPPGPLVPQPLPALTGHPGRREPEREGVATPEDRPYRPSRFDGLQGVLLHLTERFIRLMATSPSTR